ncbi:MAG: radical SAM protein, partial [Candidatus Heimdallarchaeota archaeon]|nr:radical SAM protein [Candidatus Heimdallarchaeota archaeon]
MEKQRTYRIKKGINWRKSMGNFMFLNPQTKELQIYDLEFSRYISDEGVIAMTHDTQRILENLVTQGFFEIYESISNKNTTKSISTQTYPLNVTIQITNKCNLNCVHCHRDVKNTHSLSFSQFNKIIEQLRQLNVFNVNISGGEPLLHPELARMIKTINDTGIRATVSSNAVLFTEEKVGALYNAGLRKIQVSLDSYKAEGHDRIRKTTGAFDKM